MERMAVSFLCWIIWDNFLIFTFYSQRRVLATSVNAMVVMDTLYRLTYATVAANRMDFDLSSDIFISQWFDVKSIVKVFLRLTKLVE